MTSKLSDSDIQSLLEWTKELARKAGAVILEGSVAIQEAAASAVNEKKNSVDLVTEYDVKVEELVRSEIARKYPGFYFMGEESYSAGQKDPLTDAPTFCVDPIDGTTNFVHGFPFACISIGFIYEKKPVIGVVFNPFLDQMGHGSYLVARTSPAPRRLPLSGSPKPLSSLSQALIAIEWGSDRSQQVLSVKSSSFHRLAGNPAQDVLNGRMAHSLRSVGSAALNFCMVAQGGLDLYWEIGCWAWDVCAGIVIAQEAGGVVVGSQGSFAARKDSDSPWEVTEDVLVGRKYVVMRGVPDVEGKTAHELQKELITDFYNCVGDTEAH